MEYGGYLGGVIVTCITPPYHSTPSHPHTHAAFPPLHSLLHSLTHSTLDRSTSLLTHPPLHSVTQGFTPLRYTLHLQLTHSSTYIFHSLIHSTPSFTPPSHSLTHTPPSISFNYSLHPPPSYSFMHSTLHQSVPLLLSTIKLSITLFHQPLTLSSTYQSVFH